MIEFYFDRDKDIIFTTRIGDVTVADLLKYINRVTSEYGHLANLCILDDICKSTSQFTHKDYDQITSEIIPKVSNFESIKVAVVVSKPSDTALSVLYEIVSTRIENYSYKTFSTHEAAEEWLGR